MVPCSTNFHISNLSQIWLQDGLQYNRLSAADAEAVATFLEAAAKEALAESADEALVGAVQVEARAGPPGEFVGMVHLSLALTAAQGDSTAAGSVLEALAAGLIKGALRVGQDQLGPLQVGTCHCR